MINKTNLKKNNFIINMIINLFLIKTYILYYLKCAFNLIFSFFNFFNFIMKKILKIIIL